MPTVNGSVNGYYLSNNGSTPFWSQLPTGLPAGIGHDGQFLTTNGTTASWAQLPAGFANPMTAAGDMIVGNAGGVAGKISIGSTGQVLMVQNGGPSWQSISQVPNQSGFTNSI